MSSSSSSFTIAIQYSIWCKQPRLCRQILPTDVTETRVHTPAVLYISGFVDDVIAYNSAREAVRNWHMLIVAHRPTGCSTDLTLRRMLRLTHQGQHHADPAYRWHSLRFTCALFILSFCVYVCPSVCLSVRSPFSGMIGLHVNFTNYGRMLLIWGHASVLLWRLAALE